MMKTILTISVWSLKTMHIDIHRAIQVRSCPRHIFQFINRSLNTEGGHDERYKTNEQNTVIRHYQQYDQVCHTVHAIQDTINFILILNATRTGGSYRPISFIDMTRIPILSEVSALYLYCKLKLINWPIHTISRTRSWRRPCFPTEHPQLTSERHRDWSIHIYRWTESNPQCHRSFHPISRRSTEEWISLSVMSTTQKKG